MTGKDFMHLLAYDAHLQKKVYKYIDFEGGMSMLGSCNVRFTSAVDLNDEYDCNAELFNYETFQKIVTALNLPEEIVKFAIQKDANEISHWGVCSLCKTSDNVSLWENYAGENGICIELDVERTIRALEKLGKKVPLLTVYYYDTVSGMVERTLARQKDEFLRYIMIHRLVTSKSKINATTGMNSETEDEMRLVLFERVESQEPVYLNLPKDCITNVFFNDKMSMANLRNLSSLLRRKYNFSPQRFFFG